MAAPLKDAETPDDAARSDVFESAPKVGRDDEPTQVTKLLDELREERSKTRISLLAAGTKARHLGRRLRRSGSHQHLRAVSETPPPIESTTE